MKTLIMILLIVATLHGYKIEYTITSGQAQKLATATTYFYPIPQINTGTEDNPVWEDSCTAEEWTIQHYRDVMWKTWKRYSEKMKKDTIQADPW